ncbi:MAG: aminodeoxychorismate/anthranilate synthase component II [Spirochaetaceae bacterium]|jgi:anthranilate synthase component 2|nr:aminodeoxychorismate/anthranilate synthase component II [Spirochaetaceae bacterium]
MILLIDNYDSFSYNLFQLAGSINPDIRVIRNDELSADGIARLAPSHIILSPGPGKPSDSGVCEDVVRVFAGKIPILGVCLGHQAICEVMGATVTYAKHLMHGKPSDIALDGNCAIFRGLPSHITGARYHSLAVLEETIGGTAPGGLAVTARSDDGEVMGVEIAGKNVYGVQFHPESILTPKGRKILENFAVI